MTPCPCDTLKAGEEEIMEGNILLRGVLGLRACWLAWLQGGTTGKAAEQLALANVMAAAPLPSSSPSWPRIGST